MSLEFLYSYQTGMMMMVMMKVIMTIIVKVRIITFMGLLLRNQMR